MKRYSSNAFRVPVTSSKSRVPVPCAKFLRQLHDTKLAIVDEFSPKTSPQLLRLALNEAEALAWQSGVPELVFPALALEKAQTLAAWQIRQRSLQETEVSLAA